MGLTLTAEPLVAVMLPGVITPVPPVKTAVKLLLAPEAIDVGLAVKLVIVTVVAGVTVTLTVCVTAVPVVGVTVSV